MPKRAIIGFAGIALALVTKDTLTEYQTEAGVQLLHAGSMNRTVKESKQDVYYDNNLYAQIRDVTGEEVEIRVAEAPMAQLQALGLGVYDAASETFEGEFAVAGKSYALRWVGDTVDKLPFYFNYRVFDLTGIRFDNFTTRKDSASVCEVIITGVFKKPQMASLKPWAMMQLKEDRSNEAACLAFLTAAETRPEA